MWIIAVLVTVLNIPFKILSHPVFRVMFWLANLGTVNASIARQSTDAEFERVVKLLKIDLAELKTKGAIFTLIADEWSWRRKRFVGVTLKSSRPIPVLGSDSLDLLIRFYDNASAEILLGTIRDALSILDLRLSDIHGLTTDAALAMIKVGDLMAKERKNQPFLSSNLLRPCYKFGSPGNYKREKSEFRRFRK